MFYLDHLDDYYDYYSGSDPDLLSSTTSSFLFGASHDQLNNDSYKISIKLKDPGVLVPKYGIDFLSKYEDKWQESEDMHLDRLFSVYKLAVDDHCAGDVAPNDSCQVDECMHLHLLFEKHESLVHYDNAYLLNYLFFCFILTNNVLGVHELLTEFDNIWEFDINLRNIEKLDDCLYGGILQNPNCHSMFKYIKSKLKYTDTESDGEVTINVVVLASFVHSVSDTSDVLQLLIGHIYKTDERLFHKIICHPFVDLDSMQLMVKGAKIYFANSENSETNLRLYLRIIQALCNMYVKCGDTKYKSGILSKIKLIVGFIKTKQDEERFLTGMGYCVEIGIKNGNWILVRYLTTIEKYQKLLFESHNICFIENMIKLAIREKRYHTLHVICTDLITEGMAVCIDIPEGVPDNLFLTHYMLEKGASVKGNRYSEDALFEYTDFWVSLLRSRHILMLWLLCCYHSDVNHDEGEELCLLAFFVNNNDDAQMTAIAVKLLIKMGADVDQYGRFEVDPPIWLAVQKDMMRVVRILIYNNCNLNVWIECYFDECMLTQATLLEKQYEMLQVLLLCGAEKPPDCENGKIKLPQTFDEKNDRFREWLENWLQQPHSLKFFCRKTLRNHFQKELPGYLATKNHPQLLKGYIRTKYLF